MKLLVVTPYTASHFDAGLFWVKQLHQLGHRVVLWDYRAQPPNVEEWEGVEASIVFKGEMVDPEVVPPPRVCYYPDDPQRTPKVVPILAKYDKVFTPVRPTPEGMEWLPTGYDPEFHRNLHKLRWISTLYVGTNNSEYKQNMVKRICPAGLAGNGWRGNPPVYLEDFVEYLNQGKILVNLHHNPKVGLNRKFFEMIACGFTITDRVPGVEEVLGVELARKVSFRDLREAHKVIGKYLRVEPEEREALWRVERSKVEGYTYKAAAERVVECLKELL